MAKAPTATQRTARLKLEKAGDVQRLNVSVPRDITAKDFSRLGEIIIKTIHGQTGCTCLSGIIPVVFTDQAQDAIIVQLG